HLLCCYLFCFFFFQAEDGIRDLIVTGVQTCALPIFLVLSGGDACRAVPMDARGRTDFPPASLFRRAMCVPAGVARVWRGLFFGEIGRASCRKECMFGWWGVVCVWSVDMC